MAKFYQKQFQKLLAFICKEYFPLIEKVSEVSVHNFVAVCLSSLLRINNSKKCNLLCNFDYFYRFQKKQPLHSISVDFRVIYQNL